MGCSVNHVIEVGKDRWRTEGVKGGGIYFQSAVHERATESREGADLIGLYELTAS